MMFAHFLCTARQCDACASSHTAARVSICVWVFCCVRVSLMYVSQLCSPLSRECSWMLTPSVCPQTVRGGRVSWYRLLDTSAATHYSAVTAICLFCSKTG